MDNRSLADKEILSILWNEYKDQNEWQRHNETQRATFSNILLGVSSALIAVSGSNSVNLDRKAVLVLSIFMGLFGVVVVTKYWERFVYHTRQERALRSYIDSYFPLARGEGEGADQDYSELALSVSSRVFSDSDKIGIVSRLRESTKLDHRSDWETILFGLFRDNRIRQHYLWIAMFWFISLISLTMLIYPVELPVILSIWILSILLLALWIHSIRIIS